MKMSTDQRGMTLVETLMAASIAAMIVAVLGSAIFLLLRTTEQGNDQFRALHDVQNTGYWLTRDGEMAESVVVSGVSGNMTLTLGWTDGSVDHTVTYHRSGTGGTDLKRDDNDGTGTTEKIIARYISSVDYSISAEGLITAAVAYSPSGRWEVSEEAVYKIWPRPTV